MAKKPIEQMNYEELRAEVKLMSDEMARMKRAYEDLLYNLDMDNFSGQFVKEANGFKSSVRQTAEEIRAEVQKSTETLDGKIKENAASITVNADAITAEVTAREQGDNGLNEKISTVSQTAEGIKAEVATVKSGVETNKASIEANAKAIKSKVEKKDIEDAVADFSSVTQTAEAIQSMVLKRLDMKSAEKVRKDNVPLGKLVPDDANEEKVYCIQEPLVVDGEEVTDEEGNIVPVSETYYYYNTVLGDWTELDSDSIYTVFEQTADGFVMRGNVKITGDLISGGTITGVSVGTATTIWGDCIRLNSNPQAGLAALEVVCNKTVIGRWCLITDNGIYSAITGNSVYPIHMSFIKALEDWDFSEANIVWGENNQPVCVFGTGE